MELAASSTSAALPLTSRATRIARSITAGGASSAAIRSLSCGVSLRRRRASTRSTMRGRHSRPGRGNSIARSIRRSTAGPSLVEALVIQMTGASVVSTNRFMNTFDPRLPSAPSSSTPRKISSASSTTRIVRPVRPTTARASINADTRSWRLGSPDWSSVSPTKTTRASSLRASVRANSVFPVPGDPCSSRLTPLVRLPSAAAISLSANSRGAPR